ncbi:lamin tail domain-containing protein [Bacteroidales bacterium OttesenSCG-928-K03]|nr:lamin tail domain-containing protein [Odoribacter sp. OttesenSCG-928-L07]MDL2242635.1 lamin tail domain-containing protein [Bacteroidales bacterium OttesenSCG-928-K03]
MKKILLYLISIFIVLAATINYSSAQHNESDIIITEILYNPPGTDTLEFIEFYNSGTIPYNLDGYKLTGPFTFTFGDVSILPESYYVLANDSAAMRRAFGVTCGQWGSGSLTNTNRMIRLADAQQNLIDSLHYYSAEPWPAINSSRGGPSIELNNMFSDNSDGSNWKLSTNYGVELTNGDILYCSPGAHNLPYLPQADFSTQTRVKPAGSSFNFENNSFGDNLTYNWSFEGGNPNSSTQVNPTITYSNHGIYDVSLNIQNSAGTDNITKENYIGILRTDCNTVETFPFEESFTSNPECWIIQAAASGGGWSLCNNFGFDDNNSIKFDCTSTTIDETSKIITPKLDLSNITMINLSFAYYAEISSTTPVILKVNELSENLDLIDSQEIELINESWSFFTKELNNNTAYIVVFATNKSDNSAIYIDNFLISDAPANSFKVSGTVKDIFDVPVNNLMISATSGIITHTNQNGYYELFVDNSWSGIIKAENPQYLYTPEYHQISNIQDNIENLNFTAAALPSGWIFNKTSDSHSFCILYDAFPTNNQISFGSWIGIFYKDNNEEEKCCGAAWYSDNATLCLNAWAANSITGDEGFIEGGEIIWKLFDHTNSTTDYVIVEYLSGPTTFQIDGVSIINNFSLDIATQELIIPEGWSGISSYVIPSNLQLESIFSEHLNKIVAITNDDGVYIPNDPNSTVSNWNSETGWLIKSNEDIVVNINGNLNDNLDINLPVGWTLFPIKTNQPVEVTQLFDGITNNIDIIKGYGFNDIYIPGITNNFILEPGKAYKIRMNSASTITFIPCKSSMILQTESNDNEIYNSITKTSTDHVFVFIDNTTLKEGDQILAFTNDNLCVGIGEVNHKYTAIFKVFGNDFTTDIIDGLLENEKIKFKLIRDNKTYNVNIQFATNTINYDYFTNDGISYISKVKIIPVGILNYDETISFYPNPANDIINIELNGNTDDKQEIKIYDLTGKIAKKIAVSSTDKMQVYIGDLANGIYYINYGKHNLKLVKM